MADLRRRGSVRSRTTLLATAISGSALLLGAALLLLTLDRSLHRAGDDLARGRVHDLAGQVVAGTLPTTLPIGGEGVGQVFDSTGSVLAASPNVAGKEPILDAAGAPSTAPAMQVVRNAPDDNQTEDYRVWVRTVHSQAGPVTVVAGASLESVSEASRALRRNLAVGLPVLLALLAFGTWLVIGRTLRPVEDIRAEVESISEDDLGRRVPVPATADEVARLAATMNQMLARLEEASRRQRDFVADASHELQSPITSLRTQLEVALDRPTNDRPTNDRPTNDRPTNDWPTNDWPVIARRLLADTDAMERLVRDLLFLARTSATARPAHSALVDLDDVALEEATRLRTRTTATVNTSEVSAAPVRGDAEELRRAVRNLLENAARHGRCAVRVSLAAEDGAVRLDVADDGPGIAAQDRERVFDRFWTTDGSRTRGSGSGLGLAIARQIATRHGGSLDLAEGGTGARFVLTLPIDESSLVD